MTGRAELRLGITDVAPVVSCGSFSARAVVGEQLPVTAWGCAETDVSSVSVGVLRSGDS